MSSERPREILFLYAGGTIGMEKGPRGYRPVSGLLERMVHSSRTFQDPTMPLGTAPVSRYGRHIRYEIKEYSPLLDSSNMGITDWVRIATDIQHYYDRYDAFIVLHGTDTMAYTASALSFMLENLDKTVIVTGSQIPISQVRNDGVDNMLDSLILAGHYDIPEVCLYFRSELMRGNRAQKTDASGLDAFESGNHPPLARVGIDIDVNWQYVRSPGRAPLQISPITNSNVATLRLFPGISTTILDNFLQPPIEGIVLETFGSGNAPDNRPDLLQALRDASDRGVIIVNITQCARGGVALEYAGGTALAEAGAVSGGDMTPEAALTKLAYLLSKDLSRAEIRRLMQTDLRGELTSRAAKERFSFREKAFIDSVAKVLATGSSDERREIEQALYPVLMCAAASLGQIDTIARMVDSGADVDIADYDGRTPLHLAAAEGHLDVLEFLLQRGADIHARDRRGDTPMDDARRHGHTAVQERLAQTLRED